MTHLGNGGSGPADNDGGRRAGPTPLAPLLRLTGLLLILGALLVVAVVVYPGGNSLASAATLSATTDPVIAAAGDIACDPLSPTYKAGVGTSTSCHQMATSDLLVNKGYSAVLALGDNQYYCGSYLAYTQVYAVTWGRLKAITRPVVGNHEGLTSPNSTYGGTGCDSTNAGAAGYFKYFGALAGDPSKGYYSFDVGAWHLIALNTQCSGFGGCGSTSPQGTWLRNDLATHSNVCTLAYWHIPRFSSGSLDASNSAYFWTALYNAHADVVLDGHDHIYERFAPQTPSGAYDPTNGIRQFTVGTGGSNHNGISTVAANSQVRNTDTFGVLQLTLHASSYTWKFVPEAGKTFTDSGTTSCH